MDITNLFNRYQIAMRTVNRGINNVIKNNVHSDITTDQFSILQYIFNNESCTSTQISNAFGIGKSAVTALVNRLVDKELVSRRRDDKDRRNIYLTVTNKGTQLVKFTEKEVYEVIGEKLSHFEATEIESFFDSLEKLARMMEEYNT